MCDLVDCLVTARMWELAPDKLALQNATKDLLSFLMASNPPDDPEEWVSMLGWLISGNVNVRLTRRQSCEMLNLWRTNLAGIGIDSRSLLVLLQTLGAHLQANVLHVLTRQHANAMGIVTLRTLSNQVWAPPIALAHGVVAPVPPIFPAVFWAAMDALAQVPGLTQDTVTVAQIDNTTDLVTRMRTAGMSWVQCFQFLDLLPRTVAVNRLQKARLFIRDAVLQLNNGWTWARALEHLAKFIAAGRVGYVPANNVQIIGPAEHQVDFHHGVDTIELIASQARVTYFAEAHAYANLDLSDLAVGRAPQITMWSHAFGRPQISARVAQLLALPDTANLAVSQWHRRNQHPYMQANIQVGASTFEVGLQILGYTQHVGYRVWHVYLTHFAPSGMNSIPQAMLQALRHLLR